MYIEVADFIQLLSWKITNLDFYLKLTLKKFDIYSTIFWMKIFTFAIY